MFLLYFMIFLIFQFLPKEVKMIRLLCLSLFFFFPKATVSFLVKDYLFLSKHKFPSANVSGSVWVEGQLSQDECRSAHRNEDWLDGCHSSVVGTVVLILFWHLPCTLFLGCLGSDPEPVHTQHMLGCSLLSSLADCWGSARRQWMSPFPSLWIIDFPASVRILLPSSVFLLLTPLLFFLSAFIIFFPSSSGESAPPAESRHHDKRGVWPSGDPALER